MEPPTIILRRDASLDDTPEPEVAAEEVLCARPQEDREEKVVTVGSQAGPNRARKEHYTLRPGLRQVVFDCASNMIKLQVGHAGR